MIATSKTIYDGQIYEKGDMIPDLGTLVCVESTNGIRKYEGDPADFGKLPIYPDLPTGSSALLYDDNTTMVCRYRADKKKWFELK